MTDENQQRNIEEYRLLREEIMNLSNMRHQTINILYTAVTALLAFAVTNGEPLLFLLAFCVIIPTYIMVINQSNGIYKIGSYLQVFYEGSDLLWETKMLQFNFKTKKKIKRWERNIILPFTVLSVMSLTLFMLNMDWSNILIVESIVKLLLAFICVVITVFIHFQMKDIDKLKETYVKEWRSIKD